MPRTLTALALVGLTTPALAQGVTLHFDADRTTALPGETVHWTVSASFTGYDDPTAYFGGFSGLFPSSNHALGDLVNPTGLMGVDTSTYFITGLNIGGIGINSLALLGTDDPANPLPIFEFDTVVGGVLGAQEIYYDASGVCTVYPDGGILTFPDEYQDFNVLSDVVAVIGPEDPSVAIHFHADRTTALPGETIRWTVSATFDGFTDFSAYFGGLSGQFRAVSGPTFGDVSSPVGLMGADSGTNEIDGMSILGIDVSNSAADGSDDPSNPIDIFQFDVTIGGYIGDETLAYYARDESAVVYPTGSVWAHPFEFDQIDVTSDTVVIDGYEPPEITLHARADATHASHGDTVLWTISASFTGQDDPTANFGGFYGQIQEIGYGRSVVRNPHGLLGADLGENIPQFGRIWGVEVSNTAFDPTNPIDIYQFETRISGLAGTGELRYLPNGVSWLFPDNTGLRPAIETDSETLESDTVNVTGRPVLKVLPEAASNRFGRSVAAQGTRVLVGRNSTGDYQDGLVNTVWVLDAASGETLMQLATESGHHGDYFSHDVAVDGDLALIGAPRDAVNGTNSGAAYLFDLTTGDQLFKLTPDDGAEHSQFGISVAISGDMLVVGANQAAYVFDAESGQQLARLFPADDGPHLLFGIDVAVDGGLVVVGSSLDSNENGTAAGAVYVFDAASGQQVFKLLPDDGAADARFGHAVDIDGGVVVATSFRDNNNAEQTNAAYVFDVATGAQLRRFERVGRRFGNSVAVSGETLVVGAYLTNTLAFEGGAASVYELDTGHQVGIFLPAGVDVYDHLGASVAVDGRTIIAGAPQDNDLSPYNGAVYLVMLPATEACSPADLADPVGLLDLADVLAFGQAFLNADPLADLNDDGLFDLTDVNIFVDAFLAGCP